MRTRSVIILAALFSLALALTLPACKLMTDPGTHGLVTPLRGLGIGDSTGTGGPPPSPPPPTGLSIGVSGDSMATAGHQGFLQLFVWNHDATDVTVNYRFAGPQDWPGFPATGSLLVPGTASATANIPVAVPDGTPPGAYLFHYDVEKTDGTALQSGDFSLDVHPS